MVDAAQQSKVSSENQFHIHLPNRNEHVPQGNVSTLISWMQERHRSTDERGQIIQALMDGLNEPGVRAEIALAYSKQLPERSPERAAVSNLALLQRDIAEYLRMSGPPSSGDPATDARAQSLVERIQKTIDSNQPDTRAMYLEMLVHLGPK